MDLEKVRPVLEKRTIVEGEATIEQIGNQVFYNKAQATNRDLSVCVLKHFASIRKEEFDSKSVKFHRRSKSIPNAPPSEYFLKNHQEIDGLKIFEGLSASGLRSIRYAKEVPYIGAIVACDLDRTAVESIQKHAEMNNVDDKIHPIHSDARLHMLQHPSFYDVVDLDPYGTPVEFLDSAVQSVSDGGMLCVTATDSAVLCGSFPEVCYTKYGSIPLKRPYCHEMAIRIVLQCIDHHANRYKRYIVPIVSVHVDFYVRVFVRVYISAQTSKNSPSKLAMVYQSTACDSFYFQSICEKKGEGKGQSKFGPAMAPSVPNRCPETDSKFHIGGPIWMDPIHDFVWVEALLKSITDNASNYATPAKLKGLLTTIHEELPDTPLYVDLHSMCKTIHAVVPSMNVFSSAVVHQGFRISCCHCNPKGFKTDAPFEVLWDILRAWIQKQPLCRTPDPDSAIGRLLAKEIKHDIEFSFRPISKARKEGVPRFVPNPAEWGPIARHGRKSKLEDGKGSVKKKAKTNDESSMD